MRTLDFSPLYRSTVGFDHLSSLLDSVNRGEANQPSYPPLQHRTSGDGQIPNHYGRSWL